MSEVHGLLSRRRRTVGIVGHMRESQGPIKYVQSTRPKVRETHSMQFDRTCDQGSDNLLRCLCHRLEYVQSSNNIGQCHSADKTNVVALAIA